MYRRIRRDTARKLYYSGKPILVVAKNMRPEFSVTLSYEMEEDFNKKVNAFQYYNCNRETGLTPWFYIEIVRG